jgi:hypothetical protein
MERNAKKVNATGVTFWILRRARAVKPVARRKAIANWLR